MLKNLRAFLAFCVLLVAAQTFASSADLILINGKIITVDRKDSIAEAIAIANGKIIAVGSNQEIREHADKNTRIIDLKGRTATPGLIDAHCHFDETSALYEINLSNVKSINEVRDLVRKKVSESKPGAWIL